LQDLSLAELVFTPFGICSLPGNLPAIRLQIIFSKLFHNHRRREIRRNCSEGLAARPFRPRLVSDLSALRALDCGTENPVPFRDVEPPEGYDSELISLNN
jgi:hypothetical protein